MSSVMEMRSLLGDRLSEEEYELLVRAEKLKDVTEAKIIGKLNSQDSKKLQDVVKELTNEVKNHEDEIDLMVKIYKYVDDIITETHKIGNLYEASIEIYKEFGMDYIKFISVSRKISGFFNTREKVEKMLDDLFQNDFLN